MAPPSQFQSTQWHPPRHFLPLRCPLHVQQTLTPLTASPALTARPVQTVRGPRSMERGWRTPRAQWRWSLVGGLIDILALLAWLPGPQFPSTPAPVKCSKHAGTKSVKLRPYRIHWVNTVHAQINIHFYSALDLSVILSFSNFSACHKLVTEVYISTNYCVNLKLKHSES